MNAMTKVDMEQRYIEARSSAGTDVDNALLAELDRVTNLRVIQPKMVSGRMQGAFLTLITKILRPRLVLEIGTFTGYSALSIAAGLEDGYGVETEAETETKTKTDNDTKTEAEIDFETPELHTIEVDDELEDIARSFFERSRHGYKIHLHIGSALEVVPRLAKRLGRPFDMIFIDGDKREYPAYYRMIMGDVIGESGDESRTANEADAGLGDAKTEQPSLVRSGTIILTDNVLWYGKVAASDEPGRVPNNEPGRESNNEPGSEHNDEFGREPGDDSDCEQRGRTSGVKNDRHTAGIAEFNRMVAADSRVENVILPLRDGINLIRVK